MLLLALTCERVRAADAHLVQMLMSGDLAGALRVGMERLERTPPSREPATHAALGQLLGRALLAAGRAEDAEELFQALPRRYEAMSRASVRWMSSLDQGALSLHLERPGRAAEAWHLVAEDESAPVPLRVEAMAGLAVALQHLGELRNARAALVEAQRLAAEESLDSLREMVMALDAQLAAQACLVTAKGLLDYSLNVANLRAGTEGAGDVSDNLASRAAALAHWPLAARCLGSLRLLLGEEARGAMGRARICAELKWLHECGFNAIEMSLRIDAALVLLAGDDAHGAQELLGALVHQDRPAAARPRHSLELMYCVSRLHAIHARNAEALRSYKEFARELLYRHAREQAHVPRLRFLERRLMTEEGDASMLRLPLRYRRAYRYVIDHLGDSQLSIRQVAAHVDVTERALQMAFRKHLGMTPAELIRHHRMHGIRKDLFDAAGTEGVLKTAERWGLPNRSTLAQGYRQMFSETPTATLRGRA